MSIVAVIVIEGGLVVDTIVEDDNDDVHIIVLDILESGECPACSGDLGDDDKCIDCGVNWNDPDIDKIARGLLDI